MLRHGERQHLSIPNPTNSTRICRDSFVGCIKHRNGEFALYRWKLVQKFIQALATFQVIEKGADWNTSTDKHQAAVEDIGVAVRNIGKCGHGTSLYSVVSISLVGSGGSSSEFTSPPQLFAAAAPIYAASSGQIALRAG
jgi:hypothetical protein